jgi:hypothetical protein
MQSDTYSIADIEAFASRFYQGRALLITPYAYTLTFTTLTHATSQSAIINIAANADFMALQFHHRATVSGATQTVSNKTAPLVRMLVTDSGSNEQFTSAAVDLENYSTNGNIINNLPYPRIISGRSTLTVQVTSYEAAIDMNLDVTIDGVLIRAYSN